MSKVDAPAARFNPVYVPPCSHPPLSRCEARPLIHRLLEQGQTFAQIAVHLNERFSQPRGKPWTRQSVYITASPDVRQRHLGKKGAGRRRRDPDLAEIANRTAEIRADWSEAEHRKRAMVQAERWAAPIVSVCGIGTAA